MKKKSIAKRIKKMERLLSSMVSANLKPLQSSPMKGQTPTEDKRGLQLLFQAEPEKHYRHVCPDKCASVRVNRSPKADCLRCGKPMVSTPVVHRG